MQIHMLKTEEVGLGSWIVGNVLAVDIRNPSAVLKKIKNKKS